MILGSRASLVAAKISLIPPHASIGYTFPNVLYKLIVGVVLATKLAIRFLSVSSLSSALPLVLALWRILATRVS